MGQGMTLTMRAAVRATGEDSLAPRSSERPGDRAGPRPAAVEPGVAAELPAAGTSAAAAKPAVVSPPEAAVSPPGPAPPTARPWRVRACAPLRATCRPARPRVAAAARARIAEALEARTAAADAAAATGLAVEPTVEPLAPPLPLTFLAFPPPFEAVALAFWGLVPAVCGEAVFLTLAPPLCG